jgi:NAD(P)-dependent dehydrogenase (short-subunit alcohol dehydrogenase family)
VNEPELAAKVAVVTGAASGIGRSIAQSMVGAGARIVGVDRDTEGVREACSRLEGEVLALGIDLTEDDTPSRIVEAALERFGSVDVLVNCAGIFPSTSALEISRNEWERVFGINLRAPFLCSQEIVQWAVRNGRAASIVNVASSAGVVARPGVAHYCASKAALIMLTKALAVEWAEHGIRVNAVAPGLVETPGVAELISTEQGREEHRRKIDRIPLARPGEPHEIAEAVLYLTSASYVTGETLFVDGGYSAGRTLRD